MNKVFLGGTWAETTWRDELIKIIQIPFFNPVVKDWTKECQAIKEKEKERYCNIHLYVITKEMTGVFSIAEAVESSLTNGKITIFHVMPNGFVESKLRSLKAVGKMIKKHNGISYIEDGLNRTADTLNTCFKTEY